MSWSDDYDVDAEFDAMLGRVRCGQATPEEYKELEQNARLPSGTYVEHFGHYWTCPVMNQYTSPNTCTCNPPAPREIKKKTMAPEFRLHGRNGEGWTYPGHKYGPGYLQACGCADCGVAVNLAQTLQPKYNTSEAREKFRMHWSIYKTEFGHGRSPLSEVITADGEAICYERRDELKCNGGKMNYPEARRSSFILLKKRPAHPFVDRKAHHFIKRGEEYKFTNTPYICTECLFCRKDVGGMSAVILKHHHIDCYNKRKYQGITGCPNCKDDLQTLTSDYGSFLAHVRHCWDRMNHPDKRFCLFCHDDLTALSEEDLYTHVYQCHMHRSEERGDPYCPECDDCNLERLPDYEAFVQHIKFCTGWDYCAITDDESDDSA